ncbi:MAG: hypothetical protein J6K84_01475 [Oscillospiraceae bacterium]|nr:hypothetical protein [Oscillospiraceae bacterium]
MEKNSTEMRTSQGIPPKKLAIFRKASMGETAHKSKWFLVDYGIYTDKK